jgi:hypothetical protein
MINLFKSKKVEAPVVLKEKTTITFYTKDYKKIIYDGYDLPMDIVISDVTKKGGEVKGIIKYKKVPNFGTVSINFHFVFYDGKCDTDWTNECGESTPHWYYIAQVIDDLNYQKLLR